MPFQWHGPRTGRIDPDEPPATRASDAARLPPGTQLYPEGSMPGYLEPDATLIVQRGGERFAVLVEYDRTGKPHKQLDRLRRYDRWLLDGWRHGRYSTHAIPPTVLYITAHARPLDALLHAADKTLTAWHAAPPSTANDGVYPGRERIIFTTRAKIMGGVWEMQRVPALPPPTRTSPECTPRPVDYNMPALLAGTASTMRQR